MYSETEQKGIDEFIEKISLTFQNPEVIYDELNKKIPGFDERKNIGTMRDLIEKQTKEVRDNKYVNNFYKYACGNLAFNADDFHNAYKFYKEVYEEGNKYIIKDIFDLMCFIDPSDLIDFSISDYVNYISSCDLSDLGQSSLKRIIERLNNKLKETCQKLEATERKLDEANEKITELTYKPGGSGFMEAKESFEKQINLDDNKN